MKKHVAVFAALLTIAAFAGVAVAADPTTDLLKKESAAVDKIQKKDQELKEKKKKVDDTVKEATDAPGKAVKEHKTKAEGAVKDAAAKKSEKVKKTMEATDKIKGDAGQVKDMGKKNLDDLKSIGK